MSRGKRRMETRTRWVNDDLNDGWYIDMERFRFQWAELCFFTRGVWGTVIMLI